MITRVSRLKTKETLIIDSNSQQQFEFAMLQLTVLKIYQIKILISLILCFKESNVSYVLVIIEDFIFTAKFSNKWFSSSAKMTSIQG